MHSWGDSGVDFEGISDAARYIGTNLARWGRVNVRDWKEKWGTVRVYCSFGWHQIHSITHPRYIYSQYPQWLWSLDCQYGYKITRLLNWIVVPYHKWLYRYLYGRAIRKWPHLRLEILSGADYSELLQNHGVHRVRTGKNSYDIYYDWHPNNWQKSEENDDTGTIRQ